MEKMTILRGPKPPPAAVCAGHRQNNDYFTVKDEAFN